MNMDLPDSIASILASVAALAASVGGVLVVLVIVVVIGVVSTKAKGGSLSVNAAYQKMFGLVGGETLVSVYTVEAPHGSDFFSSFVGGGWGTLAGAILSVGFTSNGAMVLAMSARAPVRFTADQAPRLEVLEGQDPGADPVSVVLIPQDDVERHWDRAPLTMSVEVIEAFEEWAQGGAGRTRPTLPPAT
jgi:hypothetical protein